MQIRGAVTDTAIRPKRTLSSAESRRDLATLSRFGFSTPGGGEDQAAVGNR
jgi:hypothetical protein